MTISRDFKSRHILLVHQAFAALDEPGGTRHHELARYLAQRGHRVTVIASPVSYLTGKARQKHIPWIERQPDIPGLVVLRAYTYPALHQSFFHRVISFISFMFSSLVIGLQVREVDLVWGTSPPIFQGITAWLLARLKGVPFLFEVRDLWPAFAVAVGVLKPRWLIQASEWLEKYLYQHADQLVVNSPGFLEHVQARGASRVALIPNGADPAMFDPQESGEAFRTRLGLQNKYVVVYAGAHGMSNHLEIVLEAAAQLLDTDQLRLVLVGDGKEKVTLQEQAAQRDLYNVIFLPPVAKLEIPHVLAGADACLAILRPIALYKTVYPNKVFDYMAAGKPVILAIDGVIREVIEQAGAGIAIPPGDPAALVEAIQSLVADPGRGKAMGQRGRAYVESHFNRARLAQQLAELIEILVEG